MVVFSHAEPPPTGRYQGVAARSPGDLPGAANGQRRASREGGFAHRYQPPPGTPHRRAAPGDLRQEVREAPAGRSPTGVRGPGRRGGRGRGSRGCAGHLNRSVLRQSPCPSTQSRASAQGPGTHRTRHRTGQHAVPLRVRPDDPHRRGPHRAAGHRAGAAAGHRHGAPEVRLPHLRGRRDPSAGAGAPHHRRIAEPRGRWRRC